MDADNEYEDYFTQCGELYLTVKGNIVFHCTLCEEISKSFEQYKNHVRIHYQEYVADDVDSSNESPSTMKDCSEPEIEEVKYKIEISNVSVAEKNVKIKKKLRRAELKESIRERKYKCTYCDYACPDKSNLHSHMKRHSLEKQHKCTECPKAFHTRTELNVHMRTHTGEKPYLCNICGCSFMTVGRLSAHRKRHSKVRDRICSICNAAFYDGASLNKHLVIHSEERRYKCSQCTATFKQPGPLRSHKKIHANKKEYGCDICGAKFNQHAGLYSHMKNQHTLCPNKIDRDFGSLSD